MSKSLQIKLAALGKLGDGPVDVIRTEVEKFLKNDPDIKLLIGEIDGVEEIDVQDAKTKVKSSK